MNHKHKWRALRAFRRTAIVAVLAVGAAGLPAFAGASPLISEVFYDAVGSDNGWSFIELSGDPGASLVGLTLVGVNGANGAPGPTVALSGAFGADGLFLLGDDAGDGSTEVAGADAIANFDFQNGPDSIQLLDGAAILDAVGYGSFGPGEFFAGEGTPAPDAPAGSSLERLFANLDSDDNALDFQIQALPTPGIAQFVAVPEPASGWLVAAGLGGLGAAMRPRRRFAARL